MKKWFIVIASLLCGCGLIPEKVKVDDPRLRPLWNAAESFNRLSYGFSPLPTTADVRLESRPRLNYDAMLHLYGKTSRTIAFRKTPAGYRWIGEQESFQGLKQYTSVDGTFYEQLVLTFDVERVSGYPTNRLSVSYWGEDARLAGQRDLTLAEAKPILKEWGY